MSTHAVKCGSCKCDLEHFPDAKPDPRAACPRCGEGDTLDNIHRIVAEFVEERLAQSIHAAVVDGVRGSKALKVTSNFRPKRNHRFVVDLDL